MAWQKGPGEGYHAAKDDALAINPKLRCRAIYYGRSDGSRELVGYVVEDGRGGQAVGKGTFPQIGETLSQIGLAIRFRRNAKWVRKQGEYVSDRGETWARMEYSDKRLAGYKLVCRDPAERLRPAVKTRGI